MYICIGRGHVRSFSSDFDVISIGSILTFLLLYPRCLWGLVEKEEKLNSHLRFVSGDSHNNDDEDDGGKTYFLNTNQHSDCPLLTESSLLRTMDAIQSAAQAKNSEQSKECVYNEKAGYTEENGIENSDEVNVRDDCFFVIDRVGETLEIVEEEKGLGRNVPHTNKHSFNCQSHRSDPNAATPTGRERKGKAHPKPNGNTPEGHFQFLMDVDGVKELGGDVDDLPGFSCEHHDTSEGENPNVTPLSIQKHELGSDEKTANETEEHKGKETDPIALLDNTLITEKQCQAVTSHRETKIMKPDTVVFLGKSIDTAIDVDDCSTGDERSEVIVVDDDDSADKLESFYCRLTENGGDEAINDTHSSHENFSAKLNGNDFVSDGDSSEGSKLSNCDHFNKGSILALPVTSNTLTGSSNASKQLVKPVFGPTGKTRARVISVLQGLTNHLRRSSFTNTVECRSRARVPIINCNTRTGFEGDIAIGGHNGVDTSTYALRQVNRFYR